MAAHGPQRRCRSPELAAGYWGSPAAAVASGPQGATYAPDCREGQLPQDRERAPGSDGRTDGLRTSPVGRAGVVGASDMATDVVVGSAGGACGGSVTALGPGARRGPAFGGPRGGGGPRSSVLGSRGRIRGRDLRRARGRGGIV
jgi:hypothetical protein